jgi:beta-glucosidase
MPWSDRVDAITTAFMPGQEYGHALADILFGAVSPSAKLPITLPNVENEVNFTASQWPGIQLVANYSEELLVGYRYYDYVDINAKFPFGHGLTYTSFALSDIAATRDLVSVDITNTGAVAGTETPQLYLHFPPSAGEPPQQLKGFEKVTLAPGEKKTVSFKLTSRSLSIWDVATHAWVEAKGEFTAAVGTSSRDIHCLKAKFVV